MEKILISLKVSKPDACPVCGNESPVFWKLPGVYWVQCSECDVATTMEEDPDVALKKWALVKYRKQLRPDILKPVKETA